MPASTIRAIRRFHALDQVALAESFAVSTRTVIRWEKRGVHPDLLPTESATHRMPDWRKKLLLWMIARFERAGSPDNRAEEATP